MSVFASYSKPGNLHVLFHSILATLPWVATTVSSALQVRDPGHTAWSGTYSFKPRHQDPNPDLTPQPIPLTSTWDVLLFKCQTIQNFANSASTFFYLIQSRLALCTFAFYDNSETVSTAENTVFLSSSFLTSCWLEMKTKDKLFIFRVSWTSDIKKWWTQMQ